MTDEEKLLIRRAEDAVDIASRNYTVSAVGFLNEAEAALLKRNSFKSDEVKIVYFGGFEEAERTLFMAVPEYADENEIKGKITALMCTGRNISGLSHRDFLGSLMGLGIERRLVGDILTFPNKCLIFVKSEIADYIIQNITKIGREGVSISKYAADEIDVPKRRTEEISASVASLRLDAVLSEALKTSRGRAAEVISSGAVSLNFEETDNLSKNISAGDILSVRKFGRFKIKEIGGTTRKGRLKIVIEKYI